MLGTLINMIDDLGRKGHEVPAPFIFPTRPSNVVIFPECSPGCPKRIHPESFIWPLDSEVSAPVQALEGLICLGVFWKVTDWLQEGRFFCSTCLPLSWCPFHGFAREQTSFSRKNLAISEHPPRPHLTPQEGFSGPS